MKKFQNHNKPPELIDELIKHFGSQTNLAKILGITRQYVADWVSGKQEIPPIYAMRIEYLTQGQFRASSLIGESKQKYLKS